MAAAACAAEQRRLENAAEDEAAMHRLRQHAHPGGYGALLWNSDAHSSRVLFVADTETEAHGRLAVLLQRVVHGEFPKALGDYKSVWFYRVVGVAPELVTFSSLFSLPNTSAPIRFQVIAERSIRPPRGTEHPVLQEVCRVLELPKRARRDEYLRLGGQSPMTSSKRQKQTFILRKRIARASPIP